MATKGSKDTAATLIRAWLDRESKAKALERAEADDERAQKALDEATRAAVSNGTSGIFQWDGDFYEIGQGPNPDPAVKRVQVGDLGGPIREAVMTANVVGERSYKLRIGDQNFDISEPFAVLLRDSGLDFEDPDTLRAFMFWRKRDGTLDGLEDFIVRWSKADG